MSPQTSKAVVFLLRNTNCIQNTSQALERAEERARQAGHKPGHIVWIGDREKQDSQSDSLAEHDRDKTPTPSSVAAGEMYSALRAITLRSTASSKHVKQSNREQDDDKGTIVVKEALHQIKIIKPAKADKATPVLTPMPAAQATSQVVHTCL